MSFLCGEQYRINLLKGASAVDLSASQGGFEAALAINSDDNLGHPDVARSRAFGNVFRMLGVQADPMRV